MQGFAEYILLLISQFAGGPGCIENNLMRFGLPAVMWAALFWVAWSRQRDVERPREKWLVWGFGLALARELFMFTFVSLQIIGVLGRESAYFISAPLEQALTMAAIVVIAGAFLRYILDDAPLARRYMQIGLGITILCYLATFWWWADHSLTDPAARFGLTWVSWLFRVASAILIVGAMAILYNKRGWLRNVMMVALFFFFMSDIFMLISMGFNETYAYILCPLSHAFYILAIPLLGYIYIREASQEREQAVDALRESEQHFRDIIEHSQAGYYYIDRQGYIRQVNNAWLEMHGYTSADEVIGRHYSIASPDEISPETQARFDKLLNGEIIPPTESTRLTKDGQIQYHTSSSNPVIERGRVIGLEGFLIDRTQQLQAEAEIQRRKEQMAVLNAITATISETRDLQHMLGSILESVLAVTEMDVGCIYLYDDAENNSLRLVAEYSQTAVWETGSCAIESGDNPLSQVARSGRALQTIIPPDAPWPAQPQYGESAGAGNLHFIGVPILSGDLVQGVLAVLGRDSREAGRGDAQLLSATAQQIGIALEKTQLAEEASRVQLLQELDRMRSELIANVSHDLRTPLGLIKFSGTSLLATDIEFSEEIRREMLGIILEETERLEKIVDDLLLLARVESGRLQLQKGQTSAVDLIEQAVSGMETALDQHLITFNVVPLSLVINLDPDRMGQVLRNLLSNAIKYSPEGGTISINAYADGEQAFLTVTDSGIGIPAQERNRVFDRFYRVDNPITRTVRGAGLGLSVCRHMVQAHGGDIWVESEFGQGSTFFISLPLDTAQETEPAPEAAAAAAAV